MMSENINYNPTVTVGSAVGKAVLDAAGANATIAGASMLFKKMMQSQKYSSTEEAYVSWTSYLNSFGLGNELGIDISGEFKGWVKDADYYNKMHGKNSWNYVLIGKKNIITEDFEVLKKEFKTALTKIHKRTYLKI